LATLRTNRQLKRKNRIVGPSLSGKFRSAVKKFYLIGIFLLLIMLFAGGDYGFIRMWQLSGRLGEMRNKVDILRVKNIDLHSEKSLLSGDDSYRKSIATEKYGMVSKGTILCRLVK